MHIISFYVVIIRIHFRFVEIAACLYNKIILDKINQLMQEPYIALLPSASGFYDRRSAKGFIQGK